jgi:XTP/dITP diphosphohydrolase
VIHLILATRNAHKVGELQALLGGRGRVWSQSDFPGAPAVIEDAGSFAGNATKKAVELAGWIRDTPAAVEKLSLTPDRDAAFVLADDSGLEVDALGGVPGVHSARFAAEDAGNSANTPDAANNAKLLGLLENVPKTKRSARFRCVIAVAPLSGDRDESASPVCYADEIELSTQLFDGTCEGRIDFAPRGSGGFGYDPLFIPDGFDQSFAELGESTKNQISHRAKAMAKFCQWLETINGPDNQSRSSS